MEIITQLDKEVKKEKNTNVVVIILNENKGYSILGKPMINWVSEKVKNYPCVSVDYKGEEIIEFLKALNIGCEYMVVLFDKTPLIAESTIKDIVEYCVLKRINACKLSVGYVFNKNYVLNTKSLFFDSLYLHHEDEFYAVENKKNLAYVRDVLQQRILNFHMSNGVEIINLKHIEIEPDVVIGKNTVIYSGNVLKGYTEIKENVILKENNVIENSVIENDACVCGSNIKNSKIGFGTIIMPYCNIDSCKIGNNCTIKGNNNITKKNIKNNQVI